MIGRIRNYLLAWRWRPVLQRLKMEMAREGKANSAMMRSYARWVEGRASEEEMRQAERQMRELLKTVGVGGLAILPFSPLTIPWLVAVGNKVGVQILPDWYYRIARKEQEKADPAKPAAEEPATRPAGEAKLPGKSTTEDAKP